MSGFILVNLFGMQALGMLMIWSVIILVCIFMSASDKMFQFVCAAFHEEDCRHLSRMTRYDGYMI